MSDLPQGIQAKITRAREHLGVLDELIGAYVGRKPYEFAAEVDANSEMRTFLTVHELPPDELWGPIIGDAVHNLRSALDHLAWLLALPSARRDTPRGIEFPIYLDDPATNPKVRRALRKKLACLRPDSHALVDAAQPYKRGDSHHPLWLLQALWNTDKHRSMHVTGILFARPETERHPMYGFTSWSSLPFDRTHGSEFRTHLGTQWPAPHPGEIEAQVHANQQQTFDVTLDGGDGDPYGGIPLRPALSFIARYVEDDVIRPLAALL